jgi:hypothetical protein
LGRSWLRDSRYSNVAWAPMFLIWITGSRRMAPECAVLMFRAPLGLAPAPLPNATCGPQGVSPIEAQLDVADAMDAPATVAKPRGMPATNTTMTTSGRKCRTGSSSAGSDAASPRHAAPSRGRNWLIATAETKALQGLDMRHVISVWVRNCVGIIGLALEGLLALFSLAAVGMLTLAFLVRRGMNLGRADRRI